MEVKVSSFFFYCSIIWCLLFLPDTNAKLPLHFAYITTFNGGPLASGSIPVVDLALEEINKRDDILQNYTLNYSSVMDSKCNRTASLDAFFNIINDDVTIVALLGCGCSGATLPVAEISHYWNIPQIAFVSAAIELTNRIRYRSFFRTIPTCTLRCLPESVAQLMREFGWNQMAIITENDRVFVEITNGLKDILETENKLLDTSLVIKTTTDPFPYNEIFNTINMNNYKIIHINGYPSMAYKILCEAYHRQMYAPKYVWILLMWYNYNWWDVANHNTSCTNEQIIQVLNGSIGTVQYGYFPLENDTIQTISGIISRPKNIVLIWHL
jgi:gamma-aminobutyric acid type B receptor